MSDIRYAPFPVSIMNLAVRCAIYRGFYTAEDYIKHATPYKYLKVWR